MFAELARYKKEHGDCHVPRDGSEYAVLGGWVIRQRTVYRRRELSADKVERLEALGFEWDPRAARWEEMFTQLVRYKDQHGDCDVPRDWSGGPELGRWVVNQRSRRSKLSPERVERLSSLGFKWNTIDASWEEMFTELVRYKKLHGTCNVPRSWEDTPGLANWVNNQRAFYKRKKLSFDQVERLEALGFEWDPRTARWEEMFSQLARYKDQHGDCDVQRGWSENTALANWVGNQRSFQRRGKLSPERRRRLEEIGFRF
jgi:hypothetical protein